MFLLECQCLNDTIDVLAGVCCWPCNLSKWEADVWGWLRGQEVCYASFQWMPAFALSLSTVWSHRGNPGKTRCREMATLPLKYILQHKEPLASSSGSLDFIVSEVLLDGWQCTVYVFSGLLWPQWPQALSNILKIASKNCIFSKN